jgi:hypothetical protein
MDKPKKRTQLQRIKTLEAAVINQQKKLDNLIVNIKRLNDNFNIMYENQQNLIKQLNDDTKRKRS